MQSRKISIYQIYSKISSITDAKYQGRRGNCGVGEDEFDDFPIKLESFVLIVIVRKLSDEALGFPKV